MVGLHAGNHLELRKSGQIFRGYVLSMLYTKTSIMWWILCNHISIDIQQSGNGTIAYSMHHDMQPGRISC